MINVFANVENYEKKGLNPYIMPYAVSPYPTIPPFKNFISWCKFNCSNEAKKTAFITQ
jgi:hypothetical protein